MSIVIDFLGNKLTRINLFALKNKADNKGSTSGEVRNIGERRQIDVYKHHPIFADRTEKRAPYVEGLALSFSLEVATWNTLGVFDLPKVCALKIHLKGFNILTPHSVPRPLIVEEGVDYDCIKRDPLPPNIAHERLLLFRIDPSISIELLRDLIISRCGISGELAPMSPPNLFCKLWCLKR